MMRLQVFRSDSVDKLKGAIRERQGIEPAMQRLIWGGKQLEDGKTLRHYGLGPNMTVHVGKLGFGCLPHSFTDCADNQFSASTVMPAYRLMALLVCFLPEVMTV